MYNTVLYFILCVWYSLEYGKAQGIVLCSLRYIAFNIELHFMLHFLYVWHGMCGVLFSMVCCILYSVYLAFCMVSYGRIWCCMVWLFMVWYLLCYLACMAWHVWYVWHVWYLRLPSCLTRPTPVSFKTDPHLAKVEPLLMVGEAVFMFIHISHYPALFQNCVRKGSDLTFGSISSLRGWSDTGAGSLER